jgi:hypothetical protein
VFPFIILGATIDQRNKNMFEVNDDPVDITVQVLKNNIALFDTSKNKDSVRYDLYSAFPMQRTGKWGAEIKVEAQTLSGSEIPTIITDGMTNANILEAINEEQSIKHIGALHEIKISKFKEQDGKIDRNLAVSKGQALLQRTALDLILKGSSIDYKTKKPIYLNSNSLVGVSSKVASTINFATATASDISKAIDTILDMTSGSNQLADTMLISETAYRKMLLATGANLESQEVMGYLKYNNITVYPTPLLNDIGNVNIGGTATNAKASAILFKNSLDVLKLFIGREPHVVGVDSFSKYDLVNLGMSVAGFAKMQTGTNDNSIVLLTNLLG